MTPQTVQRTDRVIVNHDVHFRRFDDEIVLLDLARGDYFSLNEVGSQIWVGLSEGLSLEEIATNLSRTYLDVAREELLTDCLALVDELLSKGLLRLKDR